jgi:uncharacterized delta-60 repeat protein
MRTGIARVTRMDTARVFAVGLAVILATVLVYAATAQAAPGDLDTSFSGDGRLTTAIGSSNHARDVAIQGDGKIVAAGRAYNGINNDNDFALTRYNPNGSLDATFGNSGRVTTDFSADNDIAQAVGIQADGKIVVAGYTKNGGSYANVKLPALKTTAITRLLSPNSAYRFRVRAHDNNGNLSAWRHGPTFRAKPYQEAHRAIKYRGAWKYQRIKSAYGKRVKYATARGASAWLVFRGRNVAWVAPKSRVRGKAVVFFDGKKVAVVDLRSRKALARKVVFSRNGLNPSVRHVVVVKVLGTKGRPRVDVDAFVVLR